MCTPQLDQFLSTMMRACLTTPCILQLWHMGAPIRCQRRRNLQTMREPRSATLCPSAILTYNHTTITTTTIITITTSTTAARCIHHQQCSSCKVRCASQQQTPQTTTLPAERLILLLKSQPQPPMQRCQHHKERPHHYAHPSPVTTMQLRQAPFGRTCQ